MLNTRRTNCKYWKDRIHIEYNVKIIRGRKKEMKEIYK